MSDWIQGVGWLAQSVFFSMSLLGEISHGNGWRECVEKNSLMDLKFWTGAREKNDDANEGTSVMGERIQISFIHPLVGYFWLISDHSLLLHQRK